jgi:autotransporter adhesin
LGNNAQAVGSGATAVGAGAQAVGNNSVAIGQGSVANRPNSVSVGNASTGMTRQITNVAPGTAGTDAVNVNQFNAGMNSAVSQSEAYAASGIAKAAALQQTPIFGNTGNSLTAGVGHYDGKSAIGLQYSHLMNAGKDPSFLSFGIASGSGDSTPLIHAGVSFGW